MCGFSVCIRSSGLRPQDIEALERCNSGMRHRGPDEQGVWHDAEVAFGHVRLSIIGVSNGRQPLFSEDSRLVLVCNGEIYNHHELRADLVARGARFTTLSDSEVILHAYRLYGDEFLSLLDGMFAFVLYDREQGRVVAARDAAGKKPLYRYEGQGVTVLSSEHKALFRHFVGNAATIDFEVIRQVQRHRYSVTDRATYVRQIAKVPPGHRVDFAIGQAAEERSWATRRVAPIFADNYEAAVKQTRDLLFRAVEKRLEAEVPLALLLSAGIDSSAIACICHQLGRDIQTFSAGYKGGSAADESIEAERLACDLRMPFERVVLDERRFVEDLSAILPMLDEPNGDSSMFSQWALYREIRARAFTVLLSGIGGDEVFYGYPQRNGPSAQEGLGHPGKLRRVRMLLEMLAARPLRENLEFLDFMRRQFVRNRSIFRRKVLAEVSRRCADPRNGRLDMEQMVDTTLAEELDRTYSALVRSYLPNNGLFLADKLAMAHSIEVRCPFADRQLRDHVDQLPIAYKFPRNEAKGLLKDALRGVVPDYVLDRRKTGFTPPSHFVLAGISSYENRFFRDRINSLAQVATDYYCAEVGSHRLVTRPADGALVQPSVAPH